MEINPAFMVALVVGTAMLGCVCFVYVKHRSFGLGGSCLSIFGVVLLGMSVWRSIDVSVGKGGINAKLNQIEATAREAQATAEDAAQATRQANQQVSALNNRFEVVGAQDKLKNLGLYRGPLDGYTGAGTVESIKRFQMQKGLQATGELDARTKAALELNAVSR